MQCRFGPHPRQFDSHLRESKSWSLVDGISLFGTLQAVNEFVQFRILLSAFPRVQSLVLRFNGYILVQSMFIRIVMAVETCCPVLDSRLDRAEFDSYRLYALYPVLSPSWVHAHVSAFHHLV